MIYDEMKMCKPFLISQIGYDQNSFLFAPRVMIENKEKFSRVIYKEIDECGIQKSFMRVVTIENYVLIVFYYATKCREIKSGRGGLFVINGLLVSVNDFQLKCNLVGLIATQYFEFIMQMNQMDSAFVNATCFDEGFSDELWKKIQNNPDRIVDQLHEWYFLQEIPFGSDSRKNKTRLPQLLKKRRNNYIKETVHLEDDQILHYVLVLLEKGREYLTEFGAFDVSTCEDLMQQSLLLKVTAKTLVKEHGEDGGASKEENECGEENTLDSIMTFERPGEITIFFNENLYWIGDEPLVSIGGAILNGQLTDVDGCIEMGRIVCHYNPTRISEENAKKGVDRIIEEIVTRKV